MGELHWEATRAFLAAHFFPAYGMDVLLLEATPEKLEGLIKRMEAGRTYFPLLGADILNVLRAVKRRNPDVRISGIEETEEQQRTGRGRSGSRDISIFENFQAEFRPGMRHVILFGALHPWIYTAFERLSRQILEKYRALVVFRM